MADKTCGSCRWHTEDKETGGEPYCVSTKSAFCGEVCSDDFSCGVWKAKEAVCQRGKARGGIKAALLEGDWHDKTVAEIAADVGSTPASVYSYMQRLQKEGHDIAYRDGRRANTKTGGISLPEALLAGDWSNRTVAEIAQTLGSTPKNVSNTLYRMAKEGRPVPYKKGKGGQKKRHGTPAGDGDAEGEPLEKLERLDEDEPEPDNTPTKMVEQAEGGERANNVRPYEDAETPEENPESEEGISKMETTTHTQNNEDALAYCAGRSCDECPAPVEACPDYDGDRPAMYPPGVTVEPLPYKLEPEPTVSEQEAVGRAECLNRALHCVCGERETDYGSPEDSFGKIAALWSAYRGEEYTAQDVAAMMALLKIARIGGGRATVDSWVDLAGYAACGCEIATDN